ncbi:MAG: hypothetical protein IVW57_11345 [Ktedonobacterales bacterium]|nr:hypothetical protein [Ktedonobacterales bacterium]
MIREEAIERLRAWAARAQHEAMVADTREDILNWQAQAQVLTSIANFLADQGAGMDELQIWTRIVTDRAKSMAAWLGNTTGPEAALYAGQVAGYDVALTVVRDVAGRVWPRIEPHVG